MQLPVLHPSFSEDGIRKISHRIGRTTKNKSFQTQTVFEMHMRVDAAQAQIVRGARMVNRTTRRKIAHAISSGLSEIQSVTENGIQYLDRDI